MAVGKITFGIDWASDTWTQRNNGATFPLAVPAVTQTSLAAGYAAANVLNWRRELITKSQSIAPAATWNLNLTFPVGGFTFLVNAIALWFPTASSDNFLTGSSLASVTALASTTGAFAGEEVTIGTLSNADLSAGLFGSYAPIWASRVWMLAGGVSVSSATHRFYRIKIVNGAAANTITVAKVALLTIIETEIEGEPTYTFENRNAYTPQAHGGTGIFERDFKRSIELPFRYAKDSILATMQNGFLGTIFAGNDKKIMMASMDFDSETETGGRHLHSMPMVADQSMQFAMQQQYSAKRFNGTGVLPLIEWL
jgi:hypothetical protein